MVKVISLKLTAKEERIVNLLNKEGITNSDLLRTALWYYFKTADQSKKPTEKKLVKNEENSPINSSLPTIMLNLSENDEIKLKEKKSEIILIYDYINFLKNEIDQLRKQNDNSQKQISKETFNLPENEYLRQINNNLKEKLPIFEHMKSSSIIHYEIDDLLKKRDNNLNDSVGINAKNK